MWIFLKLIHHCNIEFPRELCEENSGAVLARWNIASVFLEQRRNYFFGSVCRYLRFFQTTLAWMERILSRKQELDDQIDDMVEVDKISFTSSTTLAWMERILSRKQELDDQIDDMVEVDKISFTSFASSDDGDLRMSVQQSPIPSNFSDFKTASELSLHCQHRSRSDSENESPADSPSCSRVDTSCPVPTPSSSTLDQDVVPEAMVKSGSASSSFCIDHAWINNLSFTNELEPIPEIVSREPYWKEMEREFIALRLRDANVSKDLEESNMYMYSLRLTLAAIEEARWLNDVSKDPELSRLVHE
ncbi:hypothetical protein COOONC_01514, partial [Cooperia oncophora]